ncbi:MAG TPA: GntR family transcriptional regulator [Lacipirellulaceae bacterium]|nr:GntR family transcriptional regulator [Lacipirellulaceae bacterium]
MTLTAQIKDDLKFRVEAGGDLPTPLTLESIAKWYGVSFTPVRCAVAGLIEDGLLKKGANRRLVIQSKTIVNGRTKRKLRPHLPQPRDLSKVVANDLIKLSLKGDPVYLREEAMAERYKVSRSAIRNVFHQLAGSGMLDHIPRRGWQLRPFRQEDMQSFLEVREVLELKALSLARPRLVDRDLQALLSKNVVPVDESEPVKIDNSLHAYFIEKANNSYIKDFFQRHGSYYEILFDWEDQDRKTAIETVRQHQAILSALVERNWAQARKALSYHIRQYHPILSKIVSARRTRT